jgi:hypothetical protein
MQAVRLGLFRLEIEKLSANILAFSASGKGAKIADQIRALFNIKFTLR